MSGIEGLWKGDNSDGVMGNKERTQVAGPVQCGGYEQETDSSR